MKLEVYEDKQGFDALKPEWDDLVECSVSNVPFLTWEWQRAWWDAFGPGNQLLLLALRGADGRLDALMPLFVRDTLLDPSAAMPEIHVEHAVAVPNLVLSTRQGGELRRTLHWVGGTEVSDYLDVIASAEMHRQACAAFLDALAGQPDWQMLDLNCVPGTSPTLPVVSELARAHGWNVQQAREDVCPIVELPGSFEEYLAQRLSKKQRHELRRKMRRAEQETHVEWHWVNDATSLEPGLDVFFRLHKASAPGKQAFMDEVMQGFFCAIARSSLDKGWLRLSVLTFNGQPVASYVCFDYAGDRLVYNSGYDLSAYSDLAPGVVLVGYMIEEAIQRGLRRFDFLQGNERYKYDFGATDTEVMRLLVRR